MSGDQHEAVESDAGRRPPVDVQGVEALRARQDLLTFRDHVIGLEAESASLQQTVDKLMARQKAQQERLELVREKLERQRRRADRLEQELNALRSANPAPASGRRGIFGRLAD